MSEKPSLKQILEIYYALRASGVQRLPKPLARAASSRKDSGTCLFLYDFASNPVSNDAVPPLLKRLIDRLPWRESVRIESVYPVQPKTPRFDPLSEPVVARVVETLAQSHAIRVVCFGWRAGHALSVAVGQPLAIPPEAFEALHCPMLDGTSLEVLVLPDLRELEAFPDWRALVWESLQNFAPASTSV
ncbi:MAG: hypothetical protein ACO3A4_02370 [Silvanigrellaceae bacterium]